MNSYEMLAESYKKMMESGKIEKEVAEKEIRVLDFLSTCDKADICRLFASGAFNDIFKGYLNAAIEDAELDMKTAARLRESARWVLDTKSASDLIG